MLRIVRGALVLLGLIILGLAAGFFYLRTSLPDLSGTLELPGLSAGVEVVRDAHAVPHIYAQTPEDAHFALGVVHAQDRLWQMEFQRRVGAGRLSEVLGERALNTDKFLRTLSVYHYAELAAAQLEPETLRALEAYVAGINSYLETRSGALPPEFLFFRFEPEPWQVADVLVWGKMMAWDLSGNWDDELLRARLSTILTPEQLAELWPPYPGDAPVALPELAELYDGLPLDELWATSPKPEPPSSGSNNWVVSGERTRSGMPLLANDPHLSMRAPSLWYLAHLSAPGLDVIGATLPGTPAVLLGRNNSVAWGFTNTGPDTQDLFVERVNPENAGEYLTPEGYEPFTERREVIEVKGQEALELTVRSTRHGPVISDVSETAQSLAEADQVLAFAWTALTDDDMTLQASLNMNYAQNWDEFTNALRDFHAAQQNIVYADTSGNIGFYAPARVPIRASGQGLVPVPGWTGEHDWTGFIPFEELPHVYNPASGQVMTANHKIVPDDYPYFLTTGWTAPYRAQRITDLLAASPEHSLESFAQIQNDLFSLMAAEFAPYLADVEVSSEAEAAALAAIRGFSGAMTRQDTAPLIFAAWYRELGRLLYADELGELFGDYRGFRPSFVRSVLENRTATPWCDDVTTAPEESCEDIITLAFQRAVKELSATYGAPGKWVWGDVHYAHSAHSVFTGTPLAPLFDLKIPAGGDAFTVNAARFPIGAAEEPYRLTHGPGYRALYNLNSPETSLFMQTTGQSGNPLSGHYRDYVKLWRDGEYIPMTTTRERVEENALGTLRLEPAAR